MRGYWPLIAVVLPALSACRASTSAIQREKSTATKETKTTRLPGRLGGELGPMPGTEPEEGEGFAPFADDDEPAPILTEEERRRLEIRRAERRRSLLKEIGADKEDPYLDLLRSDGYDGPLMAGRAIESYAEGRYLAAVLFAQAAVGADPGNGSRRRLLSAISKATKIPTDPEGLLPLEALVHRELKRADTAFFDEKFGAAIQHARRALLLDDSNNGGWLRLGSAHYAIGERRRARRAYKKASIIDPNDRQLSRFMKERGWNGK